MKKDELYNVIDSLSCDIEFSYKGVGGSICPFSRTDINLMYGDIEKHYDDIDSLMGDNVFNGKCLNEIAEKIEIM